MNYTHEVMHYLRIAMDVNKKVGGTQSEAQANNRDRFVVIRDAIYKNFHFIKAKLQERDKKKGYQDTSFINAQIKDKIEEIYNELERMREAVASGKGHPDTNKIKYDLIEKLTAQTKDLQDLLDNSNNLDKKLLKRGQNATYTEMKELLLEPGQQKSLQGSRAKPSRGKRSETPAQIEMQKMQQWKKIDQQIDKELETVLDGIQRWKDGLKTTGELILITDDKIKGLSEDVEKVNETVFKSNKQLKGVLQKMRKPHKFCIDIVLVLILVALIVGIVKLSGG